MPPAHELNERLRKLWQKFHPLMLLRLEKIEKAITALNRGALPDRIRVQAVNEAHKLAGALGTFGLQAGSEAALEIERLLSAAKPHQAEADISRQFEQLKREIEGR
jgi:HPt (histidine-containing phosphotransfer) domain-containing protein